MGTSTSSHAPSAACPKCGYIRNETDAGPAWQCAACGIAISKYQASLAQAKELEAAIVVVSDQTEPRRALLNRVIIESADLRESMQKVGVVDKPDIYFLNG